MQPNGFSRSYISFDTWDPSYNISQLRMLRSFFLLDNSRKYLLSPLVKLRLVKVTHRVSTDWFQKISMLWNLETLIGIFGPGKLPSEIWNLRHIKHLIFDDGVILPDPPTSKVDFVLQNLQTLVKVQILSDKVFDMIPNVKKLVITCSRHAEHLYGLDNLARCQKLEILRINANPKSIKFPDSLRKLTIYNCNIQIGKCGVGLLPKLEWLKLLYGNFDDGEWETVEGEFQKLKSLSLCMCGLKRWTVEDCCHFPSLEHVSLDFEFQLEEIPEVFGESMTLESIKIAECSHEAVLSAKQIHDEQQCQDNYDFEVYVKQYSEDYDDKDAVEEELYSMRTDKFHVIVD